MNPPETQGEEYDRGYAAGYHDRSVEQVVMDFRDMRNITPEDLAYLSEICAKTLSDARKLSEIMQ
jgi:hypothetical protein